MKQYLCVECWHEVYADEYRTPQSIKWSDGHVCTFKSPEDIDTSHITKFEKLIEHLEEKALCDLSDGDFPETELRNAYDQEVKLMLRHAIRAKVPEVILHPFRVAGSQHIAEFEVKDLMKEDDPQKVNWHLQNTSQWIYAGCILFDSRDMRVSRHH